MGERGQRLLDGARSEEVRKDLTDALTHLRSFSSGVRELAGQLVRISEFTKIVKQQGDDLEELSDAIFDAAQRRTGKIISQTEENLNGHINKTADSFYLLAGIGTVIILLYRGHC